MLQELGIHPVGDLGAGYAGFADLAPGGFDPFFVLQAVGGIAGRGTQSPGARCYLPFPQRAEVDLEVRSAFRVKDEKLIPLQPLPCGLCEAVDSGLASSVQLGVTEVGSSLLDKKIGPFLAELPL